MFPLMPMKWTFGSVISRAGGIQDGRRGHRSNEPTVKVGLIERNVLLRRQRGEEPSRILYVVHEKAQSEGTQSDGAQSEGAQSVNSHLQSVTPGFIGIHAVFLRGDPKFCMWSQDNKTISCGNGKVEEDYGCRG